MAILVLLTSVEDRLLCLTDRNRDSSKYGICTVTKTWEDSFKERQNNILTIKIIKGKVTKLEVHFDTYLNTFACIWGENYGLQLVNITMIFKLS